MTGKELLLVLVGAATAAGAGGVAAATLMNDAPAGDGDSTALLERLDKLGTSLDDTNEILAESRDEIGGLRTRIEAVELGMHGSRGAPTTTDSGRRRVGSMHLGSTRVEEVGDGEEVEFASSFAGTEEEMQAHMDKAMKALGEKLQTGGGSPRLGTLFSEDVRLEGLTSSLSGLTKSFELRRLPENERWDRAREEVGLTDMQVEEIQAAIEERDKAIDESMVIEREEEDGASRFSVRRMDLDKTREANEAYRKRVDNTLNDDQKKAWKDNGYENAFGRGAMGTATVISIGTMTHDSSGGGESE
jgi:hypothetical protein